RGLDLGVLASGTDGALALRAERVLSEASTRRVLLYGARAYGGAVVPRGDGDDRGHRLGVDFPLLYALDVGGLYEGFFGLRGGAGGAGRGSTPGPPPRGRWVGPRRDPGGPDALRGGPGPRPARRPPGRRPGARPPPPASALGPRPCHPRQRSMDRPPLRSSG